MKSGFFARLAWDSMKKSRRVWLPYLMTSSLCVAIFYILMALMENPVIEGMKGGRVTTEILGLGGIVIGVFSVIFLCYTHSFTIRRRKAEFGLYNVLGMDKYSIARVLCWETVITAAVSIALGLFAGIVLSKLGELVLSNMNGGEVSFGFYVSARGIMYALALYGLSFLILFANDIRQISFSSAAELMHSDRNGEKPPKANWFAALIGVIMLGAAYWMAVSIREPLKALMMFFAAVILVIIATYLLMIAGSVTMCRLLQKNKSYYYQTRHFVSVSSMAYRMKRNGAGLASICILSTTVLVMLSSTMCLNFGSRESLGNMYPRDVNMELSFSRGADAETLSSDIRNAALITADRLDMEPDNFLVYTDITLYGCFDGDKLIWDYTALDSGVRTRALDDLVSIKVLSADSVFEPGSVPEMGEGEAYICTCDTSYNNEYICIGDERIRITGSVKSVPRSFISELGQTPVICIITSHFVEIADVMASLSMSNGQKATSAVWHYDFDTVRGEEAQLEFIEEMRTYLRETTTSADRIDYYSLTSRANEISEFYALYSGFFFLGVLLSIVFLAAAALIIYYKQISEGYEDQGRFSILKKVGMTGEDIKRSINSQMLTVFFFPLGLAVIHLMFAFPMISRLLVLFGVNNTPFLMLMTAVSILGFALFYVAVYKGTAHAYYRLVNEDAI